jgi:hypothetical protein
MRADVHVRNRTGRPIAWFVLRRRGPTVGGTANSAISISSMAIA